MEGYRRDILNLPGQDVAYQLAELDGIARAGKASCHAGIMARNTDGLEGGSTRPVFKLYHYPRAASLASRHRRRYGHLFVAVVRYGGATAFLPGPGTFSHAAVGADRMIRFANPSNFLGLARWLVPLLGTAATLVLGIGLALVAFVVPPDYQQGDTVRIMYLHVPAAWLSMLIYAVMASAALGTLVWRHPLADAAGRAAAPLGAAFTFVCLVTGSLWGKPMWGTYWIWDARLTSELVLLLIYLALLALWNAFEEPARAARVAAIMTLVGAVNIPIIKFSVDWWNTLHQPASVFRAGGPAMSGSMLYPLLVMAVGATLLFFTLHLMAIRNEILARRLERFSRTQLGNSEIAGATLLGPAE